MDQLNQIITLLTEIRDRIPSASGINLVVSQPAPADVVPAPIIVPAAAAVTVLPALTYKQAVLNGLDAAASGDVNFIAKALADLQTLTPKGEKAPEDVRGLISKGLIEIARNDSEKAKAILCSFGAATPIMAEVAVADYGKLTVALKTTLAAEMASA